MLRMSTVLYNILTPSTPEQHSTGRPVREKKKTPKAAALYSIGYPYAHPDTPYPRQKKTPKTPKKVAAPISLPPPFSLEAEDEGVCSPMDRLLAMVDQAIPVEEIEPQINNENAPPIVDTKDEFDIRKMMAQIKAQSAADFALSQAQKGTKRKSIAAIPLAAHSPITQNDARSTVTTPSLATLSNGGTTPASEKRRKRQAPIPHADSICSNCGTRETTLWRRTEKGEIECNSCSLYYRKRGIKRPASLANREIYKRNRRSLPVGISEGFDVEKIMEAIVQNGNGEIASEKSL